jgi:hypothetical protein
MPAGEDVTCEAVPAAIPIDSLARLAAIDPFLTAGTCLDPFYAVDYIALAVYESWKEK